MHVIKTEKKVKKKGETDKKKEVEADKKEEGEKKKKKDETPGSPKSKKEKVGPVNYFAFLGVLVCSELTLKENQK